MLVYQRLQQLVGGLLSLIASLGDALNNADRLSTGLEKSPLAYFLALSLLVNAAQAVVFLRVQALRVGEQKEYAAELKLQAERAEKLGAILEKHNQSIVILDRVMSFVKDQMPRRKRDAHDLSESQPGVLSSTVKVPP